MPDTGTPVPGSITLTTIGSRRVTVEVREGMLDESVVSLRFGLFDGPLAVAFTASEARWLRDQIDARLIEAEARP